MVTAAAPPPTVVGHRAATPNHPLLHRRRWRENRERRERLLSRIGREIKHNTKWAKRGLTTLIYSSEPVWFTWNRSRLEPNRPPAYPLKPNRPCLLSSIPIFFNSWTPRILLTPPCMHLYFISSLFIFYAFYFHRILFHSISHFYLFYAF